MSHTYSGQISDSAIYSFKYIGDLPVNPPTPFRSDTSESNPLLPEYFISVISHPGDSIETSFGSYRLKIDPTELDGFQITKTGTLTIAGYLAQSTEYSYLGYTTVPVRYYGYFASLEYQDMLVEIHVLFPSLRGPWGSGKEVFDLLVESFNIKPRQ